MTGCGLEWFGLVCFYFIRCDLSFRLFPCMFWSWRWWFVGGSGSGRSSLRSEDVSHGTSLPISSYRPSIHPSIHPSHLPLKLVSRYLYRGVLRIARKVGREVGIPIPVPIPSVEPSFGVICPMPCMWRLSE